MDEPTDPDQTDRCVDWLQMLSDDDRQIVLLELVAYLQGKGVIEFGYGNEANECLFWVRSGRDVRREQNGR